MITGHGDTETLRTPDYETASSALRVSVSLWLVI